MKKILSVVLAAGLALSTSAFADNFYALAEAGSVSMSNTTFPNPGAVKIGAGQSSKENKITLASEFDFLLFGNSILGNQTLSQYAIRGSEKVGYEVVKDLSVTGRIGFTMNHAAVVGSGSNAALNASYTNFDFIYGFGAQYDFTEKLAATVGWESLGLFKAESGASGVSEYLTSVGVSYKF